MFVIEANQIEVPQRIEAKNSNYAAVKAMLNRLSGLTGLDFDPEAEGFRARPSFRDLVAFNFQPQNIVANPDVLFFKADTTEHREKLRTIFPYALGAVTAEVLEARFELDRISRVLRRKEAELKSLTEIANRWRLEGQSWLRQAMELGLIAPATIPGDWPTIVTMLRRAAGSNARQSRPSLAGLEVVLARLASLREVETTTARELNVHRERLNELRRFLESSEAYGEAIRVQRDRLSISTWLLTLAAEAPSDPLGQMVDPANIQIQTLCDTLKGVEISLAALPSLSETLDKEFLRRRTAASECMDRLVTVRQEIRILERSSEEVRETEASFDRVERFIGRIQQSLALFEQADETSELRQEIAALAREQVRLQGIVSESDIGRRLRNALSQVNNTASRYIPSLDAEWPESPIQLLVDDLTIRVLQGSRDYYLWEVGSGANWLAYHIAITLALQNYFMGQHNHAVPALLVYDQPSQVYFPSRAGILVEDATLADQDVAAVRKVFQLLARETASSQGRLQVIVLDHADEDVWGGIPSVSLVEEWRGGRALVPLEWFEEQGGDDGIAEN